MNYPVGADPYARPTMQRRAQSRPSRGGPMCPPDDEMRPKPRTCRGGPMCPPRNNRAGAGYGAHTPVRPYNNSFLHAGDARSRGWIYHVINNPVGADRCVRPETIGPVRVMGRTHRCAPTTFPSCGGRQIQGADSLVQSRGLRASALKGHPHQTDTLIKRIPSPNGYPHQMGGAMVTRTRMGVRA